MRSTKQFRNAGVMNEGWVIFLQTWLIWQRPSTDRKSTTKYLPFDENLMKIVPVDPEIVGLQEIMLKEQAEHIVSKSHKCLERFATICQFFFTCNF